MPRLSILVITILIALTSFAHSAPKNVILLIGDGMDEAQIALARAYEFDGKPKLYMDNMKNRGSVIVNQLSYDDPTKIQFAGESSSGATAIATGQRTTAVRVAINAFDGTPLTTILEEAQQLGFKTGLVSTARIPDATLSSFAAHAQMRFCFVLSSSSCARFNDTPILEQMLDQKVDLLVGGGTSLLSEPESGGKTIQDKIHSLGYKIITDREDLLTPVKDKKTYAVFGEDHLEPEWVGPGGKHADVFKFNEDKTDFLLEDAAACEVNPKHLGMPTLEEMSKFAIESLTNDDKGFFLMIEGALIDKQAHAARPCGTIGNLLAFDRSVELAVQYAKELGDTAVIVTADHGQAAQVIFTPEKAFPPLTFHENAKGVYQALLTKGGNELFAYYGTNNFATQSHTGVNVPIYTYGLDDPEPLTGVIEQVEIYGVMKKFLFD